MITAEHLRRLLDSPGPEATLVVVRGEARVVPVRADDAEGLVVASRDDLLGELHGASPAEDDLDRLALVLDTSVAELGG